MVRLGVNEAYNILGLQEDATLDVVKTTYRQALKYHPDKGGDTAQFQRISEAYNTAVKHLDRPSRTGPSFASSRHGEHCDCGYGCGYDSDDDYYEDDDAYYEDDDEMDFFMYLFEEVLRGRASRFAHMRYARQKDEPKETPEEYNARLRKTREEREAAEARRARDEADRKREIQHEREREKAAGEKRRKAKKVKKKVTAEESKKSAEAAAVALLQRSQGTRSAVFAAARIGNAAGVQKGVWEESVDAAGGEVLPGAVAFVQQPPKDVQQTLLHIAAAKGDTGLIKWLIEHNAEADERDSREFTAFHIALAKGYLDVVKYFIATYPPREEEHFPIYRAPKSTSLLTMALQTAEPELVWIILEGRLASLEEIHHSWAWIQSSTGKTALSEPGLKGASKWDEIVHMLKVYGKLTPPPSR